MEWSGLGSPSLSRSWLLPVPLPCHSAPSRRTGSVWTLTGQRDLGLGLLSGSGGWSREGHRTLGGAAGSGLRKASPFSGCGGRFRGPVQEVWPGPSAALSPPGSPTTGPPAVPAGAYPVPGLPRPRATWGEGVRLRSAPVLVPAVVLRRTRAARGGRAVYVRGMSPCPWRLHLRARAGQGSGRRPTPAWTSRPALTAHRDAGPEKRAQQWTRPRGGPPRTSSSRSAGQPEGDGD